MLSIAIFASLTLVSCGSRHSTVDTSVSKANETGKTNSVDASKIETATNNNLKVDKKTEYNKDTDELIETETFTPIDPTKLATYIDDDGKTQTLDNTSKTKTKTRRSINEKNKDDTSSDLSNKSTVLEQKDVVTNSMYNKQSQVEVKHKETERTSSYWWLLWLLLLIPLYLLWKNKSKFLI